MSADGGIGSNCGHAGASPTSRISRSLSRSISGAKLGGFNFFYSEASELVQQLLPASESGEAGQEEVLFAKHTPDLVFIVRTKHEEKHRREYNFHIGVTDVKEFIRHLLHPMHHAKSKHLDLYHDLAAERPVHTIDHALPVALDFLSVTFTEEFFETRSFLIGADMVGFAVRWRDPQMDAHGRLLEDDHMLRFAEHMDYPVAINHEKLLKKLGIKRPPSSGDGSPCSNSGSTACETSEAQLVSGYVAYRQAYEDYIRQWPQAVGSGAKRILQSKDRIRLAWSFVEQHLAISHWQTSGLIVDVVYPHSKKRLVKLNHECSQGANLLWFWPDSLLNEVCNYFGSRVAFYFAFLQFVYRFALKSAVALIVFETAWYCFQLSPWRVHHVDLMFLTCGVLVSLSGASLVKMWSRESYTWACFWGSGQVKTSVEEAHHPAFKGTPVPDEVDWSKQVLRADPWRRGVGVVLAAVVSVGYVMAVLLSIAANYHVRHMEQIDGWWRKWAPTLTTSHMDILLSLQLRVSNWLWQPIAARITTWEQHKYWHEYEIALDTRVTLLLTLTMVAALGYTAFLEPFWGMCPPLPEGTPPGEPAHISCWWSLRATLRTMVVTQFLVGLFDPFYAFGISLYTRWSRSRRLKNMSFLEYQYHLPPYDGAVESLDYQEILFPLTYFLLFGVVAPEFMALGLLVTAWSQRIIDLWKLLHLYRRPRPTETSGIGTRRMTQLRAIALVGVSVNWAVVVVYARPFCVWRIQQQLLIWGFGTAVLLVANLLIETCVEKANSQTLLLRKRMIWQQEMIQRIGVRRMKEFRPTASSPMTSEASGGASPTTAWFQGIPRLSPHNATAAYYENRRLGSLPEAHETAPVQHAWSPAPQPAGAGAGAPPATAPSASEAPAAAGAPDAGEAPAAPRERYREAEERLEKAKRALERPWYWPFPSDEATRELEEAERCLVEAEGNLGLDVEEAGLVQQGSG